MIVVKKEASRRENWQTVRIDEQNDFELLVRSPKWGDIADDDSNGSTIFYADAEERPKVCRGRVETRFAAVFVNWRGVNDEDGKPIPFSLDALKQTVAQFPVLFFQLTGIADDAYRGRDLKNYGAPLPEPTATENASPAIS